MVGSPSSAGGKHDLRWVSERSLWEKREKGISGWQQDGMGRRPSWLLHNDRGVSEDKKRTKMDATSMQEWTGSGLRETGDPAWHGPLVG